MPWCPDCSYEYNSRKRKCSKCGGHLSKGPGFTTAITYMDREWITIRVVADPHQAEYFRNFLESNGYDVAIHNGEVRNSRKSRSADSNVPETRIMVPFKNARQAARLLRSVNDGLNDNMTNCTRNNDIVVEEEYQYDDDMLTDDEQDIIQSAINLDTYNEFNNLL